MNTATTSQQQSAREFVYPTVRCVLRPTAHAATEVWPGAPRPARRAPIRAAGGLTGAPAFPPPAQRSVVIVPSRSTDHWDEVPAETQAYEERLLCSLLQLRDPALRMVYVTSGPIAPAIIDYYLSLLPSRVRRSARSRLTLVATGERSARPLSEKLLDRPRLLERIRRSIADPRSCHLVPYNTTPLESDVAAALGIPMYGADPRHSHLGTKSGCRALFARAGVPCPLGVEGIFGPEGAVDAIVRLRRERPGLERLVIKLNEGVSGEGNAIVTLDGLPAPGAVDEARSIAARVAALAPEAAGVTPQAFLRKLAVQGGIVEEWIAGELRSPSAQLQITPEGEVQLVSTHDQILGGAGGQSYLGCRFPAEASYAPVISNIALRVGEHLAAAGVIGRCAIDFVVRRADGGSWEPFAIELNLRKGGTTHPYETLACLTGGSYDPGAATFITPTGQRKFYVATDHLHGPELRDIGCDGVLSMARRGVLRFDTLRRRGVVFHMLSSLDELGRTGFTAIADTAEDADALDERVRRTMLARSIEPLNSGRVSPPAARRALSVRSA